ncbi:MAG: NAD(+)/NADH kinase [Firmicutes bacterium]|nr:NAD(+)/NADH kinase [Bacillota bacterium]
MTEKKSVIHISVNSDEYSLKTGAMLRKKLEAKGYEVTATFKPEAELIISVGGDGAFLNTLHRCGFPDIPFVGVNTGHLGFFQEISPENIDDFIEKYEAGVCVVQDLETVKATVIHQDEYRGQAVFTALNEIIVRGSNSQTVHLDLSIGGNFIEKFSGDGLLVATSAGSTAYNYSLGGAIADPRINMLQVTPIAAVNSTAYRSFTSSLMLPGSLPVRIRPEAEQPLVLIGDGNKHDITGASEVIIESSGKVIHLLRLEDYSFWKKVKTKFL